MASVIMNGFGNLSDSESSAMRMQLLKDFIPDDLCLIGAQIEQVPGQLSPHRKNHKCEEEVNASAFLEEDAFAEVSECAAETKSQWRIDADLLSVNQLLESVLETARQLGRISVSTTPDVPFKEMANHCEALLVGKQQKLSVFVASQQKQEASPGQDNTRPSDSTCANQLHTASNPFLDQNPATCPKTITTGTIVSCATEYQNQPQFMRLPASSPYDNFLKAAGY